MDFTHAVAWRVLLSDGCSFQQSHPPTSSKQNQLSLLRRVRVMANVWPLVGVYGVLWAASGVFVDILTIFWAYLTHEVLTLGSSGLWTCMASDLQFHAVLPLDEVADRCDHQPISTKRQLRSMCECEYPPVIENKLLKFAHSKTDIFHRYVEYCWIAREYLMVFVSSVDFWKWMEYLLCHEKLVASFTPCEVVDSTGAGDFFAGGFLSAWLQQESFGSHGCISRSSNMIHDT